MDVAVMLKALGEPTRFSVFQQLLLRRHCVRSLARKLEISEPAVSQHMKVLKEAGLVYGERYGHHIHYLPRQEALAELCRAFALMKEQAEERGRDPLACQCEFRRGEEI